MYNKSKQFIYPSQKYSQGICQNCNQNGHSTKYCANLLTVCTNCNQSGHSYKYCLAPVNSYGIIAFRLKDPSWTLAKGLTTNAGQTLNGIEDITQNVEFLLIQRKDSLRFVDFVRGKYDVANKNYLKQLLSNMTNEEREFLRTTTFENMWKRVWGSASVRNYKNDYEISKQRFETLKVIEEGATKPVLDDLLDTTTTIWTTPEWGFPKGRRNRREDDMNCAIREFEEETGIMREQIQIVQNMEPVNETFFGDNNVHYCHKYYLAYVPHGVNFANISTNVHMIREVGDIGWFTIDDALSRIRSENVEKREILLRVSGILRNYCFGIF